ncbi:alpha/beta hydrolase [Yoonia sediminilitoris]|uniref:Phospholipase/carboxylesterase n=1 Tax=Yoonia sediminilitoris TaxID=1286148 RepID=A0A2T6K9W8_9RHOB|nr:alpha/beta hydrolase [Yoonia sediminilitoris]PUB11608.1 phospholipase/carboxylesterase [Yoonia sediminilitoris]RCW91808.1 phospholipase/carboxylesterase [Yoonia sediminilitoris]
MTYFAKRTKGAAGQPLFLTFHGTGGNEEQFHGLAHQLRPKAWITSPRGDVSEYGALRYFARAAEGVYDMDDLAARTDAMATFIAAEKAVAKPSRTIGLGYSNGANILISVALAQPDLVDDLVLMHPLIPWAPAPQPGLAGRRVLLTAGRQDPICPAVETQQLADYLDQQGAEVSLHWHAGGHEIAQSEIAAIADFLG